MKRVLEPQIMTDLSQCCEYSNIDRATFFEFILEKLPSLDNQDIIDIGSGPGEFAKNILDRYTVKSLDLLDASENMQFIAENRLRNYNRVNFVCKDAKQIHNTYDFVICINTAHHFSELDIFWKDIQKGLNDDTKFFICDLIRPQKENDLQSIVKSCYPQISNHPEFYKDFYNSLKSAFTFSEIKNFFSYNNFLITSFTVPNTKLNLWSVQNYGTV